MRTLALALALAAIATTAAAQDRVLGADDLIAYMKKVRDFKKADEFSPSLNQADMVGRPFRAWLPFGKLYEPGNRIGGWSYDADSQTLTLSISHSAWSGITLPKLIAGGTYGLDNSDGVFVSYVQTGMGKHMASNAYGATVEVTDVEVDAFAIVQRGPTNTFRFGDYGGLKKTLQMPPEEARRVAGDLMVLIEGTTAPGVKEDVAGCGIDGFPAKIDRPMSLTMHLCAISADIRRIGIFTRSGQALADWGPGSGKIVDPSDMPPAKVAPPPAPPPAAAPAPTPPAAPPARPATHRRNH